MGFVYRAFDANLQTTVVVKSPRRDLIGSAERTSHFEREVRALVKLSFPHVVPILDVGRHEGVPFAVMRFLSGGSLEERLRESANQGSPLPCSSLKDWLYGIARTLDLVHKEKYLHRDVKPSNILFDTHQQAYLSDFGLAQALGDLRTSRDDAGPTFVGTPVYMAPELFLNNKLDGRADQYALAVTVFEVLAGRAPFEADTFAELEAAHLRSIPPSLAESVPGIPPGVAQAVSRALSKNVAERFPTCADFALAVLRGSGGAAAKSPPATRPVAVAPSSRDTPLIDTGTVTAGTVPSDTVAQSSADFRRPRSATRETPVSPPRRSKSRSKARQRRAVPPLAIYLGAGVLALIVGSALFWMPGGEAEPEARQSADGPPPPAELARRLERCGQRLQELENSRVVESGPVLEQMRYASADELIAQLNARGLEKGDPKQSSFPEIQQEFKSLDRLRSERAKRVSRQAQRSGAMQLADGNSGEERELAELEPVFHGFSERMQLYWQNCQSQKFAYDDAATNEIAALRDLDTVLAARRRTTPRKNTLARAPEWAERGQPALSLKALGFLARCGDLTRSRAIVSRLDRALPEQQIDLCWSLIVSSQPPGIAIAADHLQRHADLVSQIRLNDWLELIDESPDAFEAVLDALAHGAETYDARFRVFQSQSRLSGAGWGEGVLQACRRGDLKGEKVAEEILTKHRTPGYSLVESLLAQDPQLSLDSAPAAELPAWQRESPSLGGMLIARFLQSGTVAQRQAAVGLYGAASSQAVRQRLLRSLAKDPVRDPTALLNELIKSNHRQTVPLAESLLTRPDGLQPDKIEFDNASAANLDSDGVRKELMRLAWKVTPVGRDWAIKQLLGQPFCADISLLATECDAAIDDLKFIARLVDGKEIVLDKPADSAADGRIRIHYEELRKFREIKAGDWSPDESRRMKLAALRTRLSAVASDTPADARGRLTSIDAYLLDLQSLASVTFELEKVYENTFARQLPGAKRELRSRPSDSWNFRFFRTDQATFERERPKLDDLIKRLESHRRSLPNFSSRQGPQTAP